MAESADQTPEDAFPIDTGVGSYEVDALVVGAGISGLAAGLELQNHLTDVLVVDAADRPGGVMRTDHAQGYVFERGPNTFQIKPPMLALLRAQHLEDALQRASPESNHRFLLRDGALTPVPLSPGAMARSPLLSPRGKLRLMAEPFVRRGDAANETVSEFVSRRLGAEVAENLVGPFLTGIYAGDEHQLGAEAVFPSLVDAERRSGSMAFGLLSGAARRRRGQTLAGTYSGRLSGGGMGPLARALADRLTLPALLERRVVSLEPLEGGWSIVLQGPAGMAQVRCPRVVLAASAKGAAEILSPVDAVLTRTLESISYAPLVSVSVGVDPAEVRGQLRGFGFLVPRSEGLRLLGCLFMSRLFPGRAPEGHELLQCLLGGVRAPEVVDLPDDEVRRIVLDELDQVLGLRGAPQVLAITRYPRAVPQPGRDHRRVVETLRQRLPQLPGLSLAGSYLEGVGVPDSLQSGLEAAVSLVGAA